MAVDPKQTKFNASAPTAGTKAINLALQGGGSHGAFMWGVLDRLLEDERLSFDGITATSMGAVNAVVLADGLAAGGREGAKNLLRTFWRGMSDATSFSVLGPSFIDQINPNFGLDYSPGYVFWDMITRFMSPYQLNPLGVNPLRDLLDEVVNFERVRQQRIVKLFISATTVRSGKAKVFRNAEITADHVVGAACLPFRMRAPEIDGETYWDGGFMGNPAIFPVIYGCEARDIIVIQVTPTERLELPTDSRAILNRMQEISFNSSLMREMRAISFVTKLIDDGRLTGGKRILIHLIEAEDVISKLAASSKMNAEWRFLTYLFSVGRERADKWLIDNFDSIGSKSTIDLDDKYM
jgi:NTE family protein